MKAPASCGLKRVMSALWIARPGGGFVTALNHQVRPVPPDAWRGRPAVKAAVNGQVSLRAGPEGCTSIAVCGPKTETLKTVSKDY